MVEPIAIEGGSKNPVKQDPRARIIKVHWGGGALLILEFAWGENHEGLAGTTQDTYKELSFSDPDNSPDWFPFASPEGINSIGEGNSANLALIPDALARGVFTADPMRTSSADIPANSPGESDSGIKAYFQTVFINLNKYTADSDGNLLFTLNIPAFTPQTFYTSWFVAWDTPASGQAAVVTSTGPEAFTYSLYGVDGVYDQSAAMGFLADHGDPGPPIHPAGSLICGQVFETLDEAAAYAAAHNIHADWYRTVEMPLIVEYTSFFLSVTAGTYISTDKNEAQPDWPHGPFEFPMTIPNPDFFGGEPFDQHGWGPPFPIGIYDEAFPWPDLENFDGDFGFSSNAPPGATAEQTYYFHVEKDPQISGIPKWRIHWHGPDNPEG